MRIALVIGSLVLAAQAANACPAALPPTLWHGPIAVAFVAAADEPELVATIDGAAFGGSGWPEHSDGVLVVGSSVRYVGPLAGLTSGALHPSVGTLDDAVDLAIAELERTEQPQRVLYLVGGVDMPTFSRYRERARRSGIDTYVWSALPPVDTARPYSESQLVPPDPPAAPAAPPRWPAVALLLAAAALSRRASRV